MKPGADSDFVAPGWCLRFMGGAMKGRTMALRPGRNVAGSAADCDLLLPGGDVLPRHLVFNVGELVASVQRAEGAPVTLNGEDMVPPRRSLAAGDLLGIGAITLQVERSYPAPEAADPMFAGPRSELPGEAARPGPAPARGAGLLLLACAGLLGLGLWAGGEDRPAAAVADPAAVARAVAPFAETEAVAGPGGQVMVKGFVESRARRQALEQALSPFGDRVALDVYAADELVEQARRYVGGAGLGVDYAGGGRLVVSGASDDEALRRRVRQLGEDLHPAVRVSDKVSWRRAPGPDKDAELRARWAAWQQALPSRLVGITQDEDGLRSVQLANGSRYYEGALLKSGAELTRIDADGLVLQGGAGAPRK